VGALVRHEKLLVAAGPRHNPVEGGALSVPSQAAGAPRDSTFTAVFSLLVTLMGCAVVVLTMPRPVEPVNMPPLVLDASAVAAQRAADETLAANLPAGKDVEELRARYLDEGRAERTVNPGTSGMAERRGEFKLLARRVLARVGSQGALALRAEATERFMRALRGELSAGPELDGLVGNFLTVMGRYGLVDAELTVVAPEATVRAMYKARWNIVHERPPRDGLTRLDLQAYEGWNALHATNLSAARRLEAARVFYEVGGRHGAEAYAIAAYRARALGEAEKLLIAAQKQQSSLRVRNELMAVWRAKR
jgi:hypothetical protein